MVIIVRISISYFPLVRYFLPNQIGVSTAVWKPKYWSYGLTKRGSFQGIEERALAPVQIEQYCCKECPHKVTIPNCPFLTAYRNYLNTVDINYLLSEFKRITEDVKKINNYEGEPEIILLVYETPDNPCSERQPLIDYFEKHGIKIEEYVKETS